MKKKRSIFQVGLYAVTASFMLAFAALFGGCASGEEDFLPDYGKEEVVSYSVVFKEKGFQDVVVTVKEGEDVVTLPPLRGNAKTGYELVWEQTELVDVTKNIVVNAVERAKTYTITFDLSGGVMDEKSLLVTFDESYVLPTPTLTGFQFVAWLYQGKEIPERGTWQIDGENMQLTAVFETWLGPL